MELDAFPNVSKEMAYQRARRAEFANAKPASWADAASFEAGRQELLAEIDERIAALLADPQAHEAEAERYARAMDAQLDAGFQALGILP